MNEDRRKEIERQIFHLREVIELYLAHGTTRDVEWLRREVSELESILLLCPRKKKEKTHERL